MGSRFHYLRRFSSHLTRRFLHCSSWLASWSLLPLLLPGFILATETARPRLLGATPCVNLPE
jgi:hypothetical protein